MRNTGRQAALSSVCLGSAQCGLCLLHKHSETRMPGFELPNLSVNTLCRNCAALSRRKQHSPAPNACNDQVFLQFCFHPFPIEVFSPTPCSMFPTVTLWISTLMSQPLTAKSFAEISGEIVFPTGERSSLKAHFFEGGTISDRQGSVISCQLHLEELAQEWDQGSYAFCSHNPPLSSLASDDYAWQQLRLHQDLSWVPPISKRCSHKIQGQIKELPFKVLAFVWFGGKGLSCPSPRLWRVMLTL